MTLTKRGTKGAPITAQEHDDNLDHVMARANHTGTQLASSISDLTAAVAAHSDVSAAKAKLNLMTVTSLVNLDQMAARVNGLDAAVVLRGSWDASVGTFPGGGTAQAGDSWVISVAGTVDSVAFQVGDRVLALVDNASTTTYGTAWLKLDYTDRVSSVVGQTGTITKAALLAALNVEDGAEVNPTGNEIATLLDSFLGSSDWRQDQSSASRKLYPSDLLRGAYQLQVPLDLNADTFADTIAANAVAKYEIAGIYEVTADGNAVRFRADVNAPVLSGGSTRPRNERRQANGNGSGTAFDCTSTSAFQVYLGRARVTQVPGTKPDVAFMQLKYASGAQEFLIKTAAGNLILDDQVGGSVTLMSGYTLGDWVNVICIVGNSRAVFLIGCPDGTQVSVSVPVSGTGYFKDGCYTLANASEGTGYGQTEIFAGSGWFAMPAAAITGMINGIIGNDSWQGKKVAINAQTGTAYTAVLADAGKSVTMDNAAANVFTIPANASVAFEVGTIINVQRLGAGATTIQAAAGVTLNGVTPGSAPIQARYTSASLKKIGTNTWTIEGNIGTVV